MSVRVGTAGWSVPKQHAAALAREGSSLSRYSQVFGCAEINSTFYRSHRVSTYERWAATVPEGFRFSVKVPKAITHECGLAPRREQFTAFLDEVRVLGSRLGPLLLQLPPKQGFNDAVARRLFGLLREVYPDGEAALEPRHPEWFGADAEALLREFKIARVAADPARVAEAARPGGDLSLVYYRLHGSPRMYYSRYAEEWLGELATELRTRAEGASAWCIFDNTASGAALGDALELAGMLTAAPSVR